MVGQRGPGEHIGYPLEEVHKLQEELKEKELANETLEEEKKSPHQDDEELESNFNSQDQRPYSFKGITTHHKNITGRKIQFSSKTQLRLKLRNPKHMEFLTSLEHRMPKLAVLSLSKIPVNSEEVKAFLATRFPSKVRAFSFSSSALSSSLPLYMDELAAVSQRVRDALDIHNFEVSQPQLVTLFAAYKNKIAFGFTACKLSLSSVPDFGGSLQGSTLNLLTLSYCGGSAYGDWASNDFHFENLVEGLSKEQDFKNNLGRIEMHECGMERETVEEILAKHGFGHVEIKCHSK